MRLNNIVNALFHTPFDEQNFPNLFYPLVGAALVLLVIAIVLYNVQTRRLHRHPPLVALQEWLLWTAICVFGLILIEAIFHFFLFTVIVTVVAGVAVFIWIRFFYFPPQVVAYNQMLRRARSQRQQRYRSPETTIRSRRSTSRPRRRR